MLELFQSLSDDQTALVGCGAAMIGAMMMLLVSYYANPQNRQASSESVSPKLADQQKMEEENQRRAA